MQRAPALKSLRLISCDRVTIERSEVSLMKFPLLEELELSDCYSFQDKGAFEVIAKSFPRLKHLRLIRSPQSYYKPSTDIDDREATAIAGMHKLRSLELWNNRMTSKGLMAILENCRHLDLIIIRDCPNLTMDDELLPRCARVKIITLRSGDYPYSYLRRLQYFAPRCSSCVFYSRIYTRRECECCVGYDYIFIYDFFPEDLIDYYYLSEMYEPDLDDDEYAKMVAKKFRRYLKVNTEG
ncbi:hypothetical protein ACP4OV_013219 [Aristida adscensionis]